MAEPSTTDIPNVAPSKTMVEKNLDIYGINPMLAKTNFISKQLFQQLDSACALAYGILQNDQELSRRVREFAFVRQLKLKAYSQESADVIMASLYPQISQIKGYDEKMAAIVVDYIQNRKSIHDILEFIYQNINPAGLRVLYVNIDALIEKVKEIEDKETRKPVLERLELMKKVFDQIKALENRELVEEQKRRLGGVIQRLEAGIRDGSWNGFLKKYGIATDVDYWISAWGKYHNKEFVDMLKRKKEKYGETNPEEWLGKPSKQEDWTNSSRLPDSLWDYYTSMDLIINRRLSALWQIIARISESLKAVIENLFGKNPSSALEKIRKRVDVLDRRLKDKWEGKKNKAKGLLIAARVEAEKALNVIIPIEKQYNIFFRQKGFNLVRSYGDDKVHEKNAQSLASRKPDFSILLYLLMTARFFESNIETRMNIASSIENPVPIDSRSASNFIRLVGTAMDAYEKFLDFIEELRLGIQISQLREKITAMRGGLNG